MNLTKNMENPFLLYKWLCTRLTGNGITRNSTTQLCRCKPAVCRINSSLWAVNPIFETV